MRVWGCMYRHIDICACTYICMSYIPSIKRLTFKKILKHFYAKKPRRIVLNVMQYNTTTIENDQVHKKCASAPQKVVFLLQTVIKQKYYLKSGKISSYKELENLISKLSTYAYTSPLCFQTFSIAPFSNDMQPKPTKRYLFLHI